jgi:hypothetical protein
MMHIPIRVSAAAALAVCLAFPMSLAAKSEDAPRERPQIHAYIDSQEFRDGAKAFYLAKVRAMPQRAKMIASAEEECGGRYEGAAVNFVELSHVIEAEKKLPKDRNPDVALGAISIDVQWLVVETIACSATQAWHAKTVVYATLMSGRESVDVAFPLAEDKAGSRATVSNVKRDYAMGAPQFENLYKTPY